MFLHIGLISETTKPPRRFGGAGVLIRVQIATLNAQGHLCKIAVAISALAEGGAKTMSHQDQN